MVVDARSDNLPVPVDSPPLELAAAQIDSGGFDYGVLPSHIANALLERRSQIRAGAKKTTEAVIAIGRDLIDAKKMLEHGRFVDWV